MTLLQECLLATRTYMSALDPANYANELMQIMQHPSDRKYESGSFLFRASMQYG